MALEDAQRTSFPAAGLSGGRVHYFNLHGDLRNSPWYGQDGNNVNSYPEVCLPALIPAGVRHSVAACEACYGGDSYGTKAVRRTVNTANCPSYLNLRDAAFLIVEVGRLFQLRIAVEVVLYPKLRARLLKK